MINETELKDKEVSKLRKKLVIYLYNLYRQRKVKKINQKKNEMFDLGTNNFKHLKEQWVRNNLIYILSVHLGENNFVCNVFLHVGFRISYKTIKEIFIQVIFVIWD